MTNAIIGSTGFIGQHLVKSLPHSQSYHSKNIQEMMHQEFDTVIVAAPSSNKLLANRRPDIDKQSIDTLIDVLKTVKLNHIIVLSTISCMDDNEKETPYGKHRQFLNDWIEKHFHATILYLPAVYGKGMKKGYYRDQEHYAPLYLMGEIDAQLQPYYHFNDTYQLWEWMGEESDQLKTCLETLNISPKQFWKEAPKEAIDIEKLMENVKDIMT